MVSVISGLKSTALALAPLLGLVAYQRISSNVSINPLSTSLTIWIGLAAFWLLTWGIAARSSKVGSLSFWIRVGVFCLSSLLFTAGCAFFVFAPQIIKVAITDTAVYVVDGIMAVMYISASASLTVGSKSVA